VVIDSCRLVVTERCRRVCKQRGRQQLEQRGVAKKRLRVSTLASRLRYAMCRFVRDRTRARARFIALADGHVCRYLRLARLEMVRHGRRGWGWSTHYRLPWLRAIGVHRLSGTVQWGTTHASQ